MWLHTMRPRPVSGHSVCMSISWTPPALRDVEEAVRYLQREDAGLAQMIADRIFAGVSILERFSCAGKLGRVAETREMRIRDTPYILIYEIGAEGPVILRVLHERREWPSYAG